MLTFKFLLLACELPEIGSKRSCYYARPKHVGQNSKRVFVRACVTPHGSSIKQSVHSSACHFADHLRQAMRQQPRIVADPLVWHRHLTIDVGESVVHLRAGD